MAGGCLTGRELLVVLLIDLDVLVEDGEEATKTRDFSTLDARRLPVMRVRCTLPEASRAAAPFLGEGAVDDAVRAEPKRLREAPEAPEVQPLAPQVDETEEEVGVNLAERRVSGVERRNGKPGGVVNLTEQAGVLEPLFVGGNFGRLLGNIGYGVRRQAVAHDAPMYASPVKLRLERQIGWMSLNKTGGNYILFVPRRQRYLLCVVGSKSPAIKSSMIFTAFL